MAESELTTAGSGREGSLFNVHSCAYVVAKAVFMIRLFHSCLDFFPLIDMLNSIIYLYNSRI